MRDVVQSVRRAATLVREIASASAEQSTGIDQVNVAIAQMDGVTQQNAALVEQAAAAAASMREQAGHLAQQVRRFKVEVEAPPPRALPCGIPPARPGRDDPDPACP